MHRIHKINHNSIIFHIKQDIPASTPKTILSLTYIAHIAMYHPDAKGVLQCLVFQFSGPLLELGFMQGKMTKLTWGICSPTPGTDPTPVEPPHSAAHESHAMASTQGVRQG